MPYTGTGVLTTACLDTPVLKFLVRMERFLPAITCSEKWSQVHQHWYTSLTASGIPYLWTARDILLRLYHKVEYWLADNCSMWLIILCSGLLFLVLVFHPDVLPKLPLVVWLPQVVSKTERVTITRWTTVRLPRWFYRRNFSDLSNPLSNPIAPTQMARAKVEVLLPMCW